MWDKNENDLFNFDSDDDTGLFSTAMDIAAMRLSPEELDDHLSAYGLRREDLELIGADSMLDDFDADDSGTDDFDTSDGSWDD